MSAKAQTSVAERYDLLPDTKPIREGAVPLSPTQVVRTKPWLREVAIAGTTDLDALRRIVRYELRFAHPRGEVIRMTNQQMVRVRELGLDGGNQ